MSSCWALTSLPGCFAEVHSFSGASQVTLVVKNPPANSGDKGDSSSFPGWGRSPGGGNDTPFQYSCLGNPMDRGAWWATVHGVTKSQTWQNNSQWFLFWDSSLPGICVRQKKKKKKKLINEQIKPHTCEWNKHIFRRKHLQNVPPEELQ